ncbi:MAG: hypothetical protein LWW85_05485 [Marinilabiliales bacterium]|nr:hypothetical protein [Marinilabiliales bacterium]
MEKRVIQQDKIRKWLQSEAALLYQNEITPDSFLRRIRPLLAMLEKENHNEPLDENEIFRLLSTSCRQQNMEASEEKFFDIIDLCLYRSN